ncbi:hypothetical protein GCM10027425_08250 [Alteromonas gracilis]
MAMNGHHGNTWGNWAAVAVGLLGTIIGSVGVLLQPVSWVLFWIGLAMLPVAGIVAAVAGRADSQSTPH